MRLQALSLKKLVCSDVRTPDNLGSHLEGVCHLRRLVGRVSRQGFRPAPGAHGRCGRSLGIGTRRWCLNRVWSRFCNPKNPSCSAS